MWSPPTPRVTNTPSRAAKGVSLACGGYENNLEMQRDFHGMDVVYTAGTPGNTGDGIKMLMEAGATIVCQAIATALVNAFAQ